MRARNSASSLPLGRSSPIEVQLSIQGRAIASYSLALASRIVTVCIGSLVVRNACHVRIGCRSFSRASPHVDLLAE